MKKLLLAITLAALCAAPASAQTGDRPGGTHHPPPGPAVGGGGSSEDEKGPNLRIPSNLGAVEQEVRAAIGKWNKAELQLRRHGPKAARPSVDAAIEALEEVRGKDGECALPEYYLGIAYQLLGLYYGEKKFITSIVRLRSALRLNPTFHEAMVELGDAYGHMRKQTKAEAEYTRCITTAPDYVLAYERRATLYFQMNRLADARADIKEARRLKPHDPGLRVLERKLDLVVDGPKWSQKFEVETKNFIIRTNVSQEFADKLATNSELIRRLYVKIFPDPPRTRRKFPITVFKDRREYQRNGGPRGAGGHYDPVFKQLFLFRYAKESDTLLVLYHEGFHQFLDQILKTKAPQWFNEGVADFFGPSRYYKKGKSEGMEVRTNPWRLTLIKRLIRGGKTVSFEKLMNMSQADMYGKDAGNHYAQAWSMVYFFLQCDKQRYAGYLKRYFKALRKRKSRRKAYDYAFKKADMAALEDRWRRFILSL